MRLNQYTSQTVAENMLVQIAANAGIDNYSNSSKVKNLSDAVSAEVSAVAKSVDVLTDKLFTSTASDKFLDANGVEYGVYRRVMPSIIIDKSDQVISIEPFTGSFNSKIYDIVAIPAQTKIELGSALTLTILEDVVVHSGDTIKYISAKLEPTSGISISVRQNEAYRLDFLKNPYLSDLIIRFAETLSIASQYETDDEYRVRVEARKASAPASTENAITNAIYEVPSIVGIAYSRLYSGYADIGVLTSDLFMLGVDPNINKINKLVKERVDKYAASGSTYAIFNPEPINLIVDLNLKASTYVSDFIKNAIIKVFIDNYRYNDNNVISVELFNAKLYEVIPRSDIRITKLSILHPVLDEVLRESEDDLMIPIYSFPILLKDNINIYETSLV